MLSSPVLQTKLHIPPLRTNCLGRAHLSARLDEGLQPSVRLILVSAPAGFGKTTLLTSWANHLALPLAWLSLDTEDNDSRLFLFYLIGALQRINREIGTEALGLLQGNPGIALNAVTTSFLQPVLRLNWYQKRKQ